MILYFSGTGNSFAIASHIAKHLNERVAPMSTASQLDLSADACVGLVYPTYDFNAPPAVRLFASQMRINSKAYTFIIATCGAQVGNAIWSVRRIIERQGGGVDYCHKIRLPDNSAVAFGRNPNAQLWKINRFASRLESIVDDLKARHRAFHFSSPGLAGTILGLPSVERRLLAAFHPAVDADRCTACSMCVDICPIGNITMSSTATIGPSCAACLGCLHACPHQAITMHDKPTPKTSQYHHPDTSISDLRKSNSNKI